MKRSPDQQIDNRDIHRTQKLQACEVALHGVEHRDDQALRWFTTELVKFPPAFTPYVGLALWGRLKSGEYGWRGARNPIAYVRRTAWNIALRWQPELIFGERALVDLPGGFAGISSSRYVPHFDPSHIGEKYEFDGDWHDSLIEYLGHCSVVEAGGVDGGDSDLGNDLNCLDPELYASDISDYWPEFVDQPVQVTYDWDAIGIRLGFDIDETQLMKARAEGVSRDRMSRHLLWDHSKVEAVWKRVYRKLERPEMQDIARRALLKEVTVSDLIKAKAQR